MIEIEKEVISAVKRIAGSFDLKGIGGVKAAMSNLVVITSKLDLSRLDHWERLIRSEYDRYHKPSAWYTRPKSQDAVTWLDTVSWDGYKREEAFKQLSGGAPNSFFLSLALRRLNDWVPEVRGAARDALPRIISDSDPNDVADAFCVTLKSWVSWGRIGNQEKDLLIAMVSTRSVAQALKSKIMASPSGAMGFIMAQVGRTSVLDESLREISFHAVQPSVRAKAYRCLFEKRMVWFEGREKYWIDKRYCKQGYRAIVGTREIDVDEPFEGLLEGSANDASSIVRRIAAEILIRELNSLSSEREAYAQMFAMDKAPSVAERGKFALKVLAEV